MSPIKELAESPQPATAGGSVYEFGDSEMKFDDFAQKFTDSLLGDMGLKKTSAAAPVVNEAPPTGGGNLDDLASALSSSILEAAVGPCAKSTNNQQQPSRPFTAADISAGGVDDLASALSSSILQSSVPPPDTKVQRESADAPQKPSTVNELVNGLSSSILQSTLDGKDTKSPPLASSLEPGISDQVPAAAVPSLALNAESITKSIIADALLSSSSAPPAHKTIPSQTSGQSSDSTTCTTGKSDALGSLADQLTSSIISDVLSQPPAPNLILASQLSSSSSATSPPPLNRPAIFIQVERRGSGGVAESPRSSRSSSLTGQTITLHEYTDELVESTCREGVAIALFQAQGQEVCGGSAAAGGGDGQAVVEEKEPRDDNEGDNPASSSLDKLFDSVVSTSIQDGLQQQTSIEIEDEVQPALLSSDAPSSIASTPRVIKQSPVLSRHGLNLAGRRYPSLGSELNDPQSDNGAQFQSKLLSTPSSSLMSYAWSTASTRDEDSRPVSPTNLDRIALDLTQNIDEFSNLLSKIIVSEAITTLTGIRGLKSKIKDTATPEEEDEDIEGEVDVSNLPTTSKIDVYLSRLDQASPLPEIEETDEGIAFEVAASGGEGEVTGTTEASSTEVTGSEVVGAAYPSPWHQMRAMLLRPVATGNWGCGAFKGDPQLKSMLQWAATSAAGRPQMIYCTFANAAVKQVKPQIMHTHRLKLSAWIPHILSHSIRASLV